MSSTINLNNETEKLVLTGTARFEAGYWMGIRQSSYQANLIISGSQNNLLAVDRYDNLYSEVFGRPILEMAAKILDSQVLRHPVIGRILIMSLKILQTIGMPIMGGANAVCLDSEESQKNWIIGLPAITENIRIHDLAVRMACILMNEVSQGVSVSATLIKSELEKVTKQLNAYVPAGINTINFLEAAHELNIPWTHVANNVFQYGWGSKSRWLDSSFTDETSTISASLARDKVDSVKVLRDAGLPVPKQYLVSSIDQAFKVVESTGYPMVVKPANLDGGMGVSAGIRHEESLKRAYSEASKLSKRVVIEEFIDGNDYRFRVCKNEVIGIVARRAPSVIGNGNDSVITLIDKINTERSSFDKLYDPLVENGFKPIKIDDEVFEWLSYEGLNLHSVVADGRRVRLRGAANIMLGGTTWDVMSIAHEDNINLALSAVMALRLDIAGVDILLPDIEKSWKQVGGAICEVNGQPQLPKGIAHRQVLQRIVNDQGRIPVIVIGASVLCHSELTNIIARMKVHCKNIIIANDLSICRRGLNSKNVDAVILLLNEDFSDNSWPFDSLDLVIGKDYMINKIQAYGIVSKNIWNVDFLKNKSNLTVKLINFIKDLVMELK